MDVPAVCLCNRRADRKSGMEIFRTAVGEHFAVCGRQAFFYQYERDASIYGFGRCAWRFPVCTRKMPVEVCACGTGRFAFPYLHAHFSSVGAADVSEDRSFHWRRPCRRSNVAEQTADGGDPLGRIVYAFCLLLQSGRMDRGEPLPGEILLSAHFGGACQYSLLAEQDGYRISVFVQPGIDCDIPFIQSIHCDSGGQTLLVAGIFPFAPDPQNDRILQEQKDALDCWGDLCGDMCAVLLF